MFKVYSTQKSVQYMPMQAYCVSISGDSSTSKYLRTVSQSQRFNSEKLNKYLSKITAQHYSLLHTPPIKDEHTTLTINP
jgi:ferritin